MNARQCMLNILRDYDKGVSSLESIVDRTLSTQRMDQRDNRLVVEVVYGIFRHKLSLDFIIREFLAEDYFIKNTDLVNILRIGTYQILHLDRVPDHAAVNESVSLAKSNRNCQPVAGVINAVLRKIAANRKTLPKPSPDEPLDSRLSITYSHPRWMVKRWLGAFGLGKTKKLLEFNNTRPDIFFRRKIKGLPRGQFESDIATIADAARGGGGGYKNLYYRLKKNITPDTIRLFQDGLCTVQSPSSGWVVAMLDISEGDRILDMCAAPGGKASLMAELTGKRGAVCACDIRFFRVSRLKATLSRLHCTNVFPVVCNGEQLPFNGVYDKVLLDVPCSGTGVMHRHPDARWFRQEKDIGNVTVIQKKLLESAAASVVSGGILVYATCSLEPQENQAQIEDFLNRHPEFVLEKPYGVVKETYLDSKGFLWITPFEHAMDGMFAARMRKRADYCAPR